MKLFENIDIKPYIVSFDEFKPSFSGKDVLAEYKNKIKENADNADNSSVPSLSASLYREFVLNGNRVNYEKPWFQRRHALMRLMVGEFTFDNGDYIDSLIDYVWAVCEETSWKIPAHNNHGQGTANCNHQLPFEFEDDITFIDLFSAETGAILALIWYLFRDKLEKACPDTVVARIEYEINRQVIHPFERYYEDFWWSGYKSPYVNNWNPWILSNILTIIALFVKEYDKRQALAQKCCEMIDHYIKNIPSDGSCDEGASYWSVSGGAVFTFIEVLNDLTNGKINVNDNDILRNFGEYIVKMHISGCNQFVNFNDCSRFIAGDFPMFYRFGKLVNSSRLTGLAGEFAENNVVMYKEAMPYSGLKFFTTKIPKATFTHDKYYYMDKIQIMTARNTYRDRRIFTAAKAGANNEGHGHLDVGSFVLYVDDNPVFLDVGVQAYTKDTFNHNRFKNWAMCSPYHNTAGVDEVYQACGGQYRATDVVCDNGVFSFELKNSFSDSTGIVSIRRTINADNGFYVTDEYTFETERTYKFNLISASKPKASENRLEITIPYGATFDFELTEGYEVSYEEIRGESRAVKNWDTDCIYRTVISKKAKSGRFELVLL